MAHHPKVSREAVAVLLEVGDAIHSSASDDEQDLLLESTLGQEVFVRNACLQAMQVRHRFHGRPSIHKIL